MKVNRKHCALPVPETHCLRAERQSRQGSAVPLRQMPDSVPQNPSQGFMLTVAKP